MCHLSAVQHLRWLPHISDSAGSLLGNRGYPNFTSGVLLGWNCGDLWFSEVTSQVRAELRPNLVSGTCSVPFLVTSQLWQKAVLSLEVEHSQCCLALGDLRELSLNMEPHLRGFPGSFCREMCLWSLWKGSTLKKWHINAATWQVMKQFPHFQIPEYLLLPALM